MVELYREARDAWERRREAWALGYAGDEALYVEHTGDTAPTFKDWLRSWRSAMSSSLDEELAS